MKTALEALKAHRANWQAPRTMQEMDAYAAAEAQLVAYNARQQGLTNAATRNMDATARYYLGIDDHADQFFS